MPSYILLKCYNIYIYIKQSKSPVFIKIMVGSFLLPLLSLWLPQVTLNPGEEVHLRI